MNWKDTLIDVCICRAHYYLDICDFIFIYMHFYIDYSEKLRSLEAEKS